MKTFLEVSLIFTCLLSCSSPSPKKSAEDWLPSFDQVFTDSKGKVTFARTHYIVPKDTSLTDLLETKTLAFMDKVCKNRDANILRKYETESDYVTLKVNYDGSPKVKVYEFSCR